MACESRGPGAKAIEFKCWNLEARPAPAFANHLFPIACFLHPVGVDDFPWTSYIASFAHTQASQRTPSPTWKRALTYQDGQVPRH